MNLKKGQASEEPVGEVGEGLGGVKEKLEHGKKHALVWKSMGTKGRVPLSSLIATDKWREPENKGVQ